MSLVRRVAGRGLLVPTLFAIGACAILVGLGQWQLERLAWKEALIARVEVRTKEPPAPLPGPERWSDSFAETWEYRPVTVEGRFDTAREALVYTHLPDPRGGAHRGPGYWVLTPFVRAGGGTVIINRGFVPEALKAAPRPEPPAAAITGLLRRPEVRNLFTPDDDPGRRLLFARDPAAVAAVLGLGEVAPFTIDLREPRPDGGIPQAGETRIAFPNRHFEYAMTWFGLAGSLVAVYAVFVAGRLRGPSTPHAGAMRGAGHGEKTNSPRRS